jgi:hypothetical protein
MIRVYDLVTMQTIGEHPIDQVLGHFFPEGSPPDETSTTAGILHVGVDGFLYMTGGQRMRVPLWKIDPDSMRGVAFFGPLQGSNPTFDGDDTIALFVPMQIASIAVPQPDGGTRPLVIVQGGQAGAVTIDARTMEYVWGGRDAVLPPAIPGRHGIIQTSALDVQLVPGGSGVTGGGPLVSARHRLGQRPADRGDPADLQPGAGHHPHRLPADRHCRHRPGR